MSYSQVSIVQGVYASVKGLMRTHSPSVVIAVSNIDSDVMRALEMVSESSENGSTLVLLSRASMSKVLWMADLRSTALPNKNNQLNFFISAIAKN
ncbi:hypothetical protein ACSBR2_020677 [Camellia fascicularis]